MSDKTRLVVKDNSLIDASFNLSLVEQRLMLLGITEARELPKLSLETPVKVSVKSYIEQFNVSDSTAYEALQDAVKLSRLESFQNHFRAYVGEDLKDYAIRIREKLKDNFYVQEWFKYLEQVGYVATKLSK